MGPILAMSSAATAFALFLFAHRVFDQNGEGPRLAYMILNSPRDFIWLGHSAAVLLLIFVGLPFAAAKQSLLGVLFVQLAGFVYAFFHVVWEMGVVPVKIDPRIIHPALMANQLAWLCALGAVAFLAVGIRSRCKERGPHVYES